MRQRCRAETWLTDTPPKRCEMPDRPLFSERLYKMLLYLYPKEFRAAYGQQMCLTFRDACRVAYRQNDVGGLLALWLPTLQSPGAVSAAGL